MQGEALPFLEAHPQGRALHPHSVMRSEACRLALLNRCGNLISIKSEWSVWFAVPDELKHYYEGACRHENFNQFIHHSSRSFNTILMLYYILGTIDWVLGQRRTKPKKLAGEAASGPSPRRRRPGRRRPRMRIRGLLKHFKNGLIFALAPSVKELGADEFRSWKWTGGEGRVGSGCVQADKEGVNVQKRHHPHHPQEESSVSGLRSIQRVRRYSDGPMELADLYCGEPDLFDWGLTDESLVQLEQAVPKRLQVDLFASAKNRRGTT